MNAILPKRGHGEMDSPLDDEVDGPLAGGW